MQNVTSHAAGSESSKRGLFLIAPTDNGYYLCTGNYIEGDGNELIEKAKKLNQMSKEELDATYQKVSNSEQDRENPSLGLIDIRRTLMNTIDLKVEIDDIGTYLTMGIELSSRN